MTDLPPARKLVAAAPAAPCYDIVVLSHRDRAIRVRALTTVHDETFIVELPERTSLEGCFGFELDDGRIIQIVQAEETLAEIRGDLARFCWHIGALQQLCQIESDRLLIHHNPDLEAALTAIGAKIRTVSEPFSPEMPVRVAHDHSHDHAPAETSVASEDISRAELATGPF